MEAGGGSNVTITTTNTGAQGAPPSGRGDITIAAALTWTPVATATLTLNAVGDVNINAAVTATRGSLEVCCGRDINVNALITTTGVVATPNTGGNVLLSAGRDVNILRAPATIRSRQEPCGLTTTSGNIEICAGRDINLGNTFNGAALLTLNNSVANSTPPTGPVTPRGMTLIAGNAGTGPGAAGGTLVIAPGTIITVTGPAGISPINIFYNPTSYATPTNYTGFFATGNGGPLTQFMLVFPDGATKVFDGTTTAAFTGLKGNPAGVTLNTAGGTANFDTAAVGINKTISYTGFTLTQGPIVVAASPATLHCPPLLRNMSEERPGTSLRSRSWCARRGAASRGGARRGGRRGSPSRGAHGAAAARFLPQLAGLDLRVAGIRMPPIALAETPPPVIPAPVVVPPVYVPAPPPPRPTRN